MIGLKETPDDVSFTLSSAPPSLNLTSVDSVVPEPQPLPKAARGAVAPDPRPLPQATSGAVGDEASTSAWQKGRHEIRRMVKKLSEETKVAAILEAERRERVKKERRKVTILNY